MRTPTQAPPTVPVGRSSSEKDDVPNAIRQAVFTENGSFVAGLKRYFDLIWEHESVREYPQPDS